MLVNIVFFIPGEPSTSGDEEPDDLYCVACEKSFRTVKAMKNHQGSKKHQENVEILKEAMQDDELHLFNMENEDEEGETTTNVGGSKRSKKQRRKQRKMEEAESVMENGDVSESPAVDGLKNGDLGLDGTSPVDCEAENGETLRNENGELPDQMENVAGDSNADKSDKPSDKPLGRTVPIEARCKTCGETFPSKSKLFKHLEESGHAAIKPEFLQPAKKQTKKNKKLKR